jgi:hypothetical protein
MNIEAALREGCFRCGQPWKVGDKVHHEELDGVVYACHADPEQCHPISDSDGILV